jgi:glycosyltransferase involved in cell wall biosynthesis
VAGGRSPAARMERRAGVIQTPDATVPGVNLVGYLDAELGLGEIGRKLAGALDEARIPFAAIPYGGTPSRRTHQPGLAMTTRAPFDTNLICLNADELRGFAADVGTGMFARRYTFGLWFWETNVFRDGSADVFVDEIWTTSEYVRAAVAPRVTVPVHLVPMPFGPPARPTVPREELGVPPGFVFLFVFDFVSAERKNPLGVVEAFRSAFEPGEGPTLVLKSINGRERSPRQLAELRAAVADRRDILVLDGYVTPAERDAFVAFCDCFVSLHRSEGFGLTMAEAISHGKPVIATGYSGNLEFMDERASYLVPYRIVDVPSTWWAYAPGAVWADPELGEAAAAMRHVWQHPEEARARGARARDLLFDRFPVARTAAFLEDRLADARARGAIEARTRRPDARPAILAASRMLTEPLGRALAGGRRVAPTAVARRALQRALWPELEERRRLELELLEALATLHRTVQHLDERVQRLERETAHSTRAPSPRGTQHPPGTAQTRGQDAA